MSNHSSWKEVEEEDDFEKTAARSDYQPKRVILHFDVDSFEVQLWMIVFRPDLIGKDVPVVVINSDGKILSVNHTAKRLSVKRGEDHQALTEARLLCTKSGSVLEEITAGERYGKADSFFPLTESNRIVQAIHRALFEAIEEAEPDLNNSFPFKVERISRDELCIDVTDFVDLKFENFRKASSQGYSTCILNSQQIQDLNMPKKYINNQPTTCMEGRHGKLTSQEFRNRVQQMYPFQVETYHLDEIRLIWGARMANWIKRRIEVDTPYHVSVGVGHSKLIAKLACDLNKPNGISIITDVALPRLSKEIRFQDLPGFGGKVGDAIESLVSSKWGKNVKYINEILQASNESIDLIKVFQELDFPDYETKALDLYNKCQYKDESRVTLKIHPDFISTALSFKDCQRQQKDKFNEGLWNIAKDMKRRINYYKRLGWIAQELVIKVDYISPCSRDLFNVVLLPVKKNYFVSHNFIYGSIVEYIKQNRLRWNEIQKIHLTAKNILANK